MVHNFPPLDAGLLAARFVRAGCSGVGGIDAEFRRAFPARLWHRDRQTPGPAAESW